MLPLEPTGRLHLIPTDSTVSKKKNDLSTLMKIYPICFQGSLPNVPFPLKTFSMGAFPDGYTNNLDLGNVPSARWARCSSYWQRYYGYHAQPSGLECSCSNNCQFAEDEAQQMMMWTSSFSTKTHLMLTRCDASHQQSLEDRRENMIKTGAFFHVLFWKVLF